MEEAIFSIYNEEVQVTSLKPSQTIDWGTSIVQAPLLWHKTKGDNMKIAVLDTGAELDHPDLQANIKGYVNFTTSSVSDATDRQGHGTHCAGTIAAIDNDEGVIGVAPHAELYIAKVLGDNGSGSIQSIVNGIDWAIAQGVDIISMSLGCSADPGPFLHNAVKRARAAGIVLVAASGNESTRCGWPAAYDEVIAVGAIDQAFDKANFSNFSEEVFVSAPGVDILSTYLNHGYAKLSGTSMATPIVAGVVALLQGYARTQGLKANPEFIMKVISERSVDLGTEGRNEYFGNGLINIYKLLKNYNNNPR